MARLSALCTGHLYSPGDTYSTHFCYSVSQPQGYSAARIKCSASTNCTTAYAKSTKIYNSCYNYNNVDMMASMMLKCSGKNFTCHCLQCSYVYTHIYCCHFWSRRIKSLWCVLVCVQHFSTQDKQIQAMGTGSLITLISSYRYEMFFRTKIGTVTLDIISNYYKTPHNGTEGH